MSETGKLKMYYNIREVAAMVDLPEYTLRFWEKEFPALKPKKTSGGSRQYTAQDIELVRLIHHLLKDQGLTIKAARERLKTSRQQVVDRRGIVERLRGIRAELQEMLNQLNDLNPTPRD
jgi:DNA-binding transcriptional MerR regulator